MWSSCKSNNSIRKIYKWAVTIISNVCNIAKIVQYIEAHFLGRFSSFPLKLSLIHVLLTIPRYNQLSHEDNSTEHLFEIGQFALQNFLPNAIYREALVPHEVHIRRHLDKTVMLRIYCRASPPVAGIMIKDHFEVNVCPIAVRLTHKFVMNMESFFFPKSSSSNDNTEQAEVLGVRGNLSLFGTKYSRMDQVKFVEDSL